MSDIDQLFDRAVARAAALRRPPGSTYRVQFHKGFTFGDAAAIVPYLAELGVTHVYASPYLRAVPGSTHGYDVIDHNRLNPEVGGDDDHAAFLDALRAGGLAHILDTVPNHVGVATNDNAWWNDVLERGPASPYAKYFDIAWRDSPRAAMRDKLLLPLLGGPYGDVLEKGELKLAREDGRVFVRYYDRRFPIDPATLDGVDGVEGLNGAPGDPRSFDRLDALLQRQHYRLAYWRVAPDEINYRRFFDVNDLAALAMEREDVFEAAHALTLRLCAEGNVAGLRIDHPDGLYDPKAYFHRLQQQYLLACAQLEFHLAGPLAGRDSPSENENAQDWDALRPPLLARIDAHLKALANDQLPLYAVAEKILAVDEPMPAEWATAGTSGYDFLIMANALFVDADNEAKFTRIYQLFTGETAPFQELVYEKKRLILRISLASELHMLANRLARLARRHRGWRDFTLSGLTDALREVIACFPVYRSYVAPADGVTDVDRGRIDAAVAEAIRRNPRTEPAVFHFVRDALAQHYPETFSDEDRAAQLAFAGKFQQLTSPATAKGIEDTAFYIYNRLVSLNEVGGEPGRFGVDADSMHRYLVDRQRRWPGALSATSTHDTKRSEDVRARLNVLSEIPDEWRDRVERWRDLTSRHGQSLDGAPVPHPNDEYLLYQTLIGAYPLESADAEEVKAFVPRVQAYLRKAMREAKVRTSWVDPDAAYEAAVLDFAARILDEASGQEFLADFRAFHRRVSRLGLINSLAQTLLRLTAPGAPDTYQGCELWDFSLVDPDNRRPVDYARRRRMLHELKARDGAETTAVARELADAIEDSRAKLWVTWRTLTRRRDNPGLFSAGEYVPLEITGERRRHVFAFARHDRGRWAVVIVPRLPAGLLGDADALPVGADVWRDTRVSLPAGAAASAMGNVFTGERGSPDRDGVRLAAALSTFPVALLTSAD